METKSKYFDGQGRLSQSEESECMWEHDKYGVTRVFERCHQGVARGMAIFCVGYILFTLDQKVSHLYQFAVVPESYFNVSVLYNRAGYFNIYFSYL